MNPSLIDASGIVTEEYLIAHNLIDQNDVPYQQQPHHHHQQQPPHLQQQQRRSSSIANNGYQPQPHVASPSQLGRQSDLQQQQSPPTEGPVAHRGYGSVHEPPQVNGGHRQQQEQQLLSSRNVSIHNHRTSLPNAEAAVDEDSPLSEPFPLPPTAQELDQTTMIGSALDLDSLGGDGEGVEEMALEDNGSSTVASSQGGSSQVGLIPSSQSGQQQQQQQQQMLTGAV